MLPKKRNITKKERIKSVDIIKYIFAHSKPQKFDGMNIYRTSNSLNFNRFCVLTRKGFGFSVTRNKERRIIKEIYRCEKHRLKSGYDYIFLLYPRPQISTYQKRFKQINLYINEINSYF